MNRSFTAFYLKPRGPWRLGEQGLGMETSSLIGHSDTLFSAMCHAWLARGEFDALAHQLRNPPFKISSLFPYARLGQGILRFYPRPLLELSDPNNSTRRKRLKNAFLVTERILEHLQQSYVLPGDWQFLMGSSVVSTKDEYDAFCAVLQDQALWQLGHHTLTPRVAIDRLTNASNIYHVARLHFHESGGLFFLFEGDESWRTRVGEALYTLQHQGIGSERTYGFGMFDLEEPQPVTFSEPSPANGHFLLSLLTPSSVEIATALGGSALYNLRRRSGFVDSPLTRGLRRAQVYMVEEGALLSALPQGQVVDVRPHPHSGTFPHEVWRFGRALTLGANIDWSYHA